MTMFLEIINDDLSYNYSAIADTEVAELSGNISALEEEDDELNPLSFRIVATFLHLLIFLGGVFGNVVLILVVWRTRSLQTPTYCYLVSLAYADLIVLFSAVPEAIMSHHIGIRYILGQAGCSLLIFGNFLGINAGSLSILAFTIERYIAILRPMLAQKVCTLGRARKVIMGVWIFSVTYCAPWLALTKVTSHKENPEFYTCELRLTKEQNVYFFLADLVLFYCIPLIIAAVVYTKIALKVKSRSSDKAKLSMYRSEISMDESASFRGGRSSAILRNSGRSKSTKTQALPMLIAVVVLFAVNWLPFRGLLVYNSIAEKPWLDLWYLLFAKTLIYLNSAINPFLYNFMSRRFREAVFRFLHLKSRKSRSSSPSLNNTTRVDL